MFIEDYHEHVKFSDEKMTKVNLYESHRLFADLYGLLPGQAQKVHDHADEDKVYMVLEGEAIFTVGEEERKLGAGGVSVAPAGEVHGVRTEGERAVLLVFMAPHPRLKG